MKELISFRGKREKHFLNDDGTISARIYNDDVHYLKNGKWAEIDNTLVDKGTYYQNKSNEFQTIFTKESDDLVNVKKGNNYLKISCINYKNLNLKKIKERVEYKNNFGQVDFIYKIVNNRIKESIVLNCRDTVPSFFEFVVDTNLDLKLTNEQKIIAINNEETVFTIDTPFMIDALNNINYNLEYVLEKNDNNYRLKLLLDEEWLKRETTKFPVMIDPTIINGTGENVYSTYISTEDSDYNYSNRWYHHIGSDSSGVHRMLMKFELPKIGTGCSIVSATAYLTAQENLFIHFFPSHKAINVHNINANWDEKTATWNNMNDKFDSLIETWFQAVGYNQYAPGEDVISEIDLTSIVKKWYSGTPNYGVMLKLNDESIEDPEMVSYSCRSKAYDLYYETAYRPYLVITYLYQNGVLSYMDYNDVITSSGKISINNFNGNVTNQIVLNKIINAKFPFELSIINNNCDVILNSLNNLSYGWKLNFYETITEDKDNNALIYNDYTSAIHYFYKNEDGNYIDEEGLNLEIKFENSNLVLSDDEGNKKIFSLISDSYKLIKIINLSQDEINISYESEKITSIYNDSKKININYSSSEIKVTSEYDTSILKITNNLITSIETKFGKAFFEYDDNNLITKMIDTNGIIYKFIYYAGIPYRLQKISVCGISDKEIKNINYSYGFLTTTIIDSSNSIKKVLTFNDYGNLLGTIVYDNNSNDFNDAYGYSLNYTDSKNANNISEENTTIKYINNLIDNSSFENPNKNVGTGIIEKNNARTGLYANKINGEYQFSYNVDEDSDYTFSFFIKSSSNGKVVLLKEIDEQLEEIANKKMYENTENKYERYFISGYFEKNTKLVIKIILDNEVIGYIDDIQLEKGKVANSYNLVDNSNFRLGFETWDASDCELITLDNGIKAAKIYASPDAGGSISKFLNISGKEGDCYHLSFWYKNEGVLDTDYEFMGNMANIAFYTDDEFGGTGTTNLHLNRHASEWQFFNGCFYADKDYTDIGINIISSMEANSLYVTNLMVIKDFNQNFYEYDDKGNLIEEHDLAGNTIKKVYDKNNQLIRKEKLFENYKYEIDSTVTDRVNRGISAEGLNIEDIYDKYGNKTKEIISNPLDGGGIFWGLTYNIRLKGSNKYLKYDLKNKTFTIEENNCNHTNIALSRHNIGMSGYAYELLYENKKLACKYEQDDIATLVLNYDNGEIIENDDLFYLKENDNGSISIESYNSGYVLTYRNDKFTFEKQEDLNEQQFYFENIQNKERIITETIYDSNGENIIAKKDSLGKVTTYINDAATGQELSVTYPNGRVVNKEYNNEKISKISSSGKEIDYKYKNNVISEIIFNNNETYLFDYDDNLNVKNVKINNNILLSKEYDSNRNVVKNIFPNGATEYKYDKFDRIDEIQFSNKKYKYYYNNLDSLSKIVANNEIYDFIYDTSKRLHKYIFNDNFICNYEYTGDKLSKKSVYIDNVKYNFNYAYDNDGLLQFVSIDNFNFNTIYDGLGRKESEIINGNNYIKYYYKSNGNNTSIFIDKVQIDKDIYKFKYDNCYNITEIYLNDKLKNKYEYDEINELLLEINYDLNYKIKYKYDINGNILSKTKLNLDGSFISKDVFEYKNDEWHDQLTKFNDEIITYDSFGNPITFGKKKYTWLNGAQLSTYSDDKKEANFEYNYAGRIMKKICGNNITNYFYEGSLLTVEKRNDDILYYIYDSNNKLIGLKFNDKLYYYQKNHLGDIIGIYDENNSLVAKYCYDSWGNILSITDNSGNEITADNNIALINPFRFRSYYYDSDIELYVFKKRFYCSKISRFINIDKKINDDVLCGNIYVYCGNNPISRTDEDGEGFFLTSILLGVGAFAMGAVLQMAKNYRTGEPLTKGAFREGIAAGSGTLVTYFTGSFVLGAVVDSAISNTVQEVSKYKTGKKKATKENIKKSVASTLVKITFDTCISTIVDIEVDRGAQALGIFDVGREPTKFLTSLIGKKNLKRQGKNAISSMLDSVAEDLWYQIPFMEFFV